MTRQDLADLIRHARQARGISQHELAEAAGVYIGTARNWEHGAGLENTAKVLTALERLGWELRPTKI